MKISGLCVFGLSAVLLGTACSDDADKMATDAAVVTDGAVFADGGNVGDANSSSDVSTDAKILMARATLAAVGGSTTKGLIVFTQNAASVTVSLSIEGATQGEHGFHIHANPSCLDSVTMGDAGSDGGVIAAGGAGSHFDPNKTMMHGSIESDGGVHHAGDFGNVTVGADGKGMKVITTSEWTVGDIVNRAVIIHAKKDDLVTQPTGDSGPRVACGVIAPF
jgi:superoxide dismutase, Cu-Zn family